MAPKKETLSTTPGVRRWLPWTLLNSAQARRLGTGRDVDDPVSVLACSSTANHSRDS